MSRRPARWRARLGAALRAARAPGRSVGGRARLAAGILALLGAFAGHAAVGGWAQGRAEGAPDGWSLTAPPTRYIDEARLGDLRVDTDTWSLSQYRALSAPAGSRALGFTVTLPVDGTLEVRPRGDAPALFLERGAVPAVRTPAGGGATSCSGSLPAPGPAPYPVEITIETDHTIFASGDARLVCAGASAASAPPTLVAGLRRVLLANLTVDGTATPPPLPLALHAVALGAGAVLAGALAWLEGLAGATLTETVLTTLPLALCGMAAVVGVGWLSEVLRIPALPLHAMPLILGLCPTVCLKAGAQAVRLSRGAGPGTARVPAWTLGFTLAAIALVSFGGAERAGLAGAPLVLFSAVAALGSGRLVRGGAPDATAAVPEPGARSAAAVSEVAAGSAAALPRAALPLEAATAPLVVSWMAFVAAMGAALLGVTATGGRLYLAEAGALLGGLVWLQVQAGRVRLYNVASLTMMLGVLAALEMATRFTEAGRFWTADLQGSGAGSRTTMIATLQALDAATATTYPTTGFPVRAPPRAAATRIVCLGASSTAGAWQDSNLAEFYPALLAARLGPGTETVNQGVGGWTSFHVARFADRFLEGLDPDIVTVYLGVNEASPAPVPYAVLDAQWRVGQLAAAPRWVDQLRLFNGLRFAIQGLRGPYQDVVVPPDDFAANLEAIAARTHALGARLLLLSEAVQPEPGALAPYWERMVEVDAHHDDVAYFDTAARLAAAARANAGEPLFLDANHPTVVGHRILADAIVEELRRLGWVTR